MYIFTYLTLYIFTYVTLTNICKGFPTLLIFTGFLFSMCSLKFSLQHYFSESGDNSDMQRLPY